MCPIKNENGTGEKEQKEINNTGNGDGRYDEQTDEKIKIRTKWKSRKQIIVNFRHCGHKSPPTQKRSRIFSVIIYKVPLISGLYGVV